MAGPELVVSIGANIQQLERQMKAAANVAEQRADEIEQKFRQVNPGVGLNFAVGAIQGAIAAISFDKVIRGVMDMNKEIAGLGETAKRTGLDLARFQELRLVAAEQGVTGKTFDSGVEALAAKLNEARQTENDLTKLLTENNIKYRDRTGAVIATNEALMVAADLIARAATEQDKIKIAEAFGLPRDFVQILEDGAGALQKLAENARQSGSILDAEVIQRAKEFDDAWTGAWARFEAQAKASIVSAIQGLADLDKAAQKLFETSILSPLVLGQKIRNAISGVNPITNDSESRVGRGFSGIGQDTSEPLRINVNKPATKTSSLYGGGKSRGGGGGGGGKSDEEQAQDRLDRYIESLKRQNDVLEAEISTFGRSNAERRAAIELAKAQNDLNKLDSETRQKVIANLQREIELSEQKRVKLQGLKDAQQAVTDSSRYFGNAAIDALEDMIFNGAKAEDVMKRLAASIAKAALQAALLGEGPLAGLFGLKSSSSGGLGGLLGALVGGIGGLGGGSSNPFAEGAGGYSGMGPFASGSFTRAAGGQVRPGEAYTVGEHGREKFVPMTPGRIIPNGGNRSPIVVTQAPTYQINQSPGMTPDAVVAAIAAYDRQLDHTIRGKLATAQMRSLGG